MIPFNKPFLTGNETTYIADAVASGKISGNGAYTQKCHQFFQDRYGFHKVLLTTSCTDALEMAAMLIDINAGDEVIVPSYTFVSSALAFVREGATIVFADSLPDHPNVDPAHVAQLITPKTKAIVVVHYAGVAVAMDAIMELANQHGLYVIEDAAQAIDATYKGKPLGGIGHLGCFSFHETKNIIAGEGGLLAINDSNLTARAEILWEKGTNRASFFRGEVNKYGWKDTGSSFLPSEIVAAFLYAQLETIATIQLKRQAIWERYYNALLPLQEKGQLMLQTVPEFATNNGHMFYILCTSLETRSALIAHLKSSGIHAVFHYLALHKSDYYLKEHAPTLLLNAERYADTLLRLPFFFELTENEQDKVIESIYTFFKS